MYRNLPWVPLAVGRIIAVAPTAASPLSYLAGVWERFAGAGRRQPHDLDLGRTGGRARLCGSRKVRPNSQVG